MNTEEKVEQIAIEDIIPNRFQPRLAFDEEGLKELSESIKQHGIIQPLVLRRVGNKYEIIAGERRYKASTMAGLKTVPAIISNIDDNKSAEIALVENIQRRNLTAIEEAKSYKNLLDRGYMTQEQLAQKMGVSQSTIANKLRLLNLTQEVQDALLQEKISERHARSLLAIPKEEQKEWLDKIISKRMTVRQLDMEIKKATGKESEEIPLVNPTPDIDNIVKNTTDINAPEKKPEINLMDPNTTIETIEEDDEEGGTKPIIPNKFFNFLEDEAANMSMDPNPVNETNNEIEVLEDFDIPTNNTIEPKEEENSNLINPFFSTKEESKTDNTIEEIKPDKEPLIDPLDSIAKLDPNYENIKKEENKMDLKTAINDVRDLVNNMENKGFDLKLDEIDLEDTYQMTITIKK